MDDLEAIRCLKSGELSGLKALMEQYQVKAARAAFLITHDILLWLISVLITIEHFHRHAVVNETV